MGRWHAHAASRLGAEIVAVVDVSLKAAQELAARHGAGAIFADLDSALAEGAIDVVHVCTPLESHASLIEVTLARGCHALVEKPLVSSLAETEAALGRAHECGRLLSPVHQLPFQPGFRSLLERREQLGELVRVDYRTCSAGGRGDRPTGGVALSSRSCLIPSRCFTASSETRLPTRSSRSCASLLRTSRSRANSQVHVWTSRYRSVDGPPATNSRSSERGRPDLPICSTATRSSKPAASRDRRRSPARSGAGASSSRGRA